MLVRRLQTGMTFNAPDDQALRLFRAAHADFSHRADVRRRADAMLDALIAHVIDDVARSANSASSTRTRTHAPLNRELSLGRRAA